jgi:hypothetical protein
MQVAGYDVVVSGRLLSVARLALERYESLDDPGAALTALAGSGTRIDLFTFMQKVPDTAPKFHRLAHRMEWDNVAALEVSTFDHWWEEQIDFRARNHVRVAEKKGICVREVPFDDALVRGISAVYDESPVRQGRRYRHHHKDLETVRRENATFVDRSIFLGAFLEERLVGFAKLVCDRERSQAGFMQIVSMIRHRDKAPSNALVAAAVRSCAERGIGYLVYAGFAYGTKERDGLADFKRHNGFRRVDLPRYYVPLTSLGRAALAAGLHRPLLERVPDRLLAPLRRARGRWYERRLPAALR